MTDLWLVRHAPVVASGVCYGQSDVRLRGSHEKSVRLIEVSLGKVRPDRLYSSPWKRTLGLARALGQEWGLEPINDPRLSELDFGDWEGKRWDAIEQDQAAELRAWGDDLWNVAPPGGETTRAVYERVAAFLADLPENGVTLLVTHAGTIRVLRAIAAGDPKAIDFARPVPHLTPERLALTRTQHPG